MSSIGLLPIMVAIGSFAFLWGMVNYNGFRRLQNTIKRAEKLLGAHKENLVRLLEENLVNKESESLKKIDQLTQNLKDISQEHKFGDLLIQIKTILTDSPHAKLLENLKELENKLLSVEKYYQAQVLQYNRLTQKMPSKLIASWFRFKEIQLV